MRVLNISLYAPPELVYRLLQHLQQEPLRVYVLLEV
jgi:hypothetical protein